MARAIKKVKTDKKKLSKKFFIILYSIIGVLALVGIGLGIYFYIKNNTEESTEDFTEYAEYKINYSDIDTYVNGSTLHIFVFMYDGVAFDVEENESDARLQEYVVKLINAVTAHEDEDLVSFFLIDTSKTGNAGALTSTLLGNLTSAPALSYVYGDAYSSTTKDTEVEETISGTGTRLTTYFTEAIQYVRGLSF